MTKIQLKPEGITDVRVLSRYGDFIGEMRQGDVLELPASLGKQMVNDHPLRWAEIN